MVTGIGIEMEMGLVFKLFLMMMGVELELSLWGLGLMRPQAKKHNCAWNDDRRWLFFW